jgi:diacylglycerol O-acyltransferase
MENLTVFDELMLHVETPFLKNHVAPLIVLEKPEGETDAAYAERFMQELIDNPPLIPHGTQRLRPHKRLLGRWAWEQDPGFDIRNHIHHIRLDPPGTMEQLEALAGELHSQPLNQDRPLWDFTIISGLEDGRHFAVYGMRIHHCCIDGISGANYMLSSLLTTAPEAMPGQEGAAPVFIRRKRRESRPPRPGALAAAWAFMKGFFTFVRQARSGHNRLLPASKEIEPSLFNKNEGRTLERAFVSMTVPMERLRRIAQAASCTINDIFAVMVGNAIKTYLAEHGAPMQRSLVGVMPVSTHTAETAHRSNRFGMMFCPLHSDLEDPLQQLQALLKETRRAKEQLAELPQNFLLGLVALSAFSFLLKRGKDQSAQQGGALRGNFVISNVPFSERPLYFRGARIAGLFPLGVLSPNGTINITGVSYAGQFCIGIVADRGTAPDIAVLRPKMLATLDQLETALGLQEQPATPPSLAKAAS